LKLKESEVRALHSFPTRRSSDLFFSLLQQTLAPVPSLSNAEPLRQLQRAADYIADHCPHALRLEDICQAAGLSPSYLIRTFKQRSEERRVGKERSSSSRQYS